MKTTLALAAASLALALGLGTHAVEPVPDVAGTVRALDRQLNVAFVARDAATLDRLLLDDFLLITSSGRVVTKGGVIDEIRSPEVTLELSDSTETQVRVHGDTAVLTAVLHQKGVVKGKPFDATMRYTDTWVLKAGTWRQLSGHASKIVTAG